MKCYRQWGGIAALAAMILMTGGILTPARATAPTGQLDFPAVSNGLFAWGDTTFEVHVGTYSVNAYVGIFDPTLTILTGNPAGLTNGHVADVCNQITEDIVPPNKYEYDIKSLGDSSFPSPYGSYSQTVAAEIGSTINDFLNLSTTDTSYDWGISGGALTKMTGSAEADWSAATQLAIWDLCYNTVNADGTTSGPLTTGASSTVAGDAKAILSYEVANAKLSDVNDAAWFSSSSTNSPPNAQDQLLRIQPVPEPGFIQLAAFLSLGGLGLLRKRRGTGLRTAAALAI